jgi:hypothetical protein
MNADEMRLVVQAVEARRPAGLTLVPATVRDVTGDGSVATVQVDGDNTGQMTEATCLVAGVMPSDRVMVTFSPPRGVFVTGRVAPQSVPGTAVVAHTFSSGSFVVTAGDSDVAVLDIEMPLVDGRLYRWDIHGTAVSLGSGDIGLAVRTGGTWEFPFPVVGQAAAVYGAELNLYPFFGEDTRTVTGLTWGRQDTSDSVTRRIQLFVSAGGGVGATALLSRIVVLVTDIGRAPTPTGPPPGG